VHRWDLRCIGRGALCEYQAPRTSDGAYKLVQCLAVEPRSRTLLCGGGGNIDCWDLETGMSCLHYVHSLQESLELDKSFLTSMTMLHLLQCNRLQSDQ
jgi:hypothetical protein